MTNRPWVRSWIGWLLLPVLLIGAAGAWFLLDPGFRPARPNSNIAVDMSTDEFDRRVHDYLMDHPEVIMQSVNRLEARQRAKDETEAQAVLRSHAGQVFRDPASPVSGNPIGDVTLVEELRVVYKEFPILGPNSVFAAKAALAANKQGKYVTFHRALYQIRGVVDQGKAMEVAATVGLDVARLKTDMEDPAIQSAIEKNLALAQALRINGTPGFIAGDQILRGATDLNTLQAMIRAAREHGKELK